MVHRALAVNGQDIPLPPVPADREDPEAARALARAILDGQTPSGTWSRVSERLHQGLQEAEALMRRDPALRATASDLHSLAMEAMARRAAGCVSLGELDPTRFSPEEILSEALGQDWPTLARTLRERFPDQVDLHGHPIRIRYSSYSEEVILEASPEAILALREEDLQRLPGQEGTRRFRIGADRFPDLRAARIAAALERLFPGRSPQVPRDLDRIPDAGTPVVIPGAAGEPETAGFVGLSGGDFGIRLALFPDPGEARQATRRTLAGAMAWSIRSFPEEIRPALIDRLAGSDLLDRPLQEIQASWEALMEQARRMAEELAGLLPAFQERRRAAIREAEALRALQGQGLFPDEIREVEELRDRIAELTFSASGMEELEALGAALGRLRAAAQEREALREQLLERVEALDRERRAQEVFRSDLMDALDEVRQALWGILDLSDSGAFRARVEEIARKLQRIEEILREIQAAEARILEVARRELRCPLCGAAVLEEEGPHAHFDLEWEEWGVALPRRYRPLIEIRAGEEVVASLDLDRSGEVIPVVRRGAAARAAGQPLTIWRLDPAREQRARRLEALEAERARWRPAELLDLSDPEGEILEGVVFRPGQHRGLPEAQAEVILRQASREIRVRLVGDPDLPTGRPLAVRIGRVIARQPGRLVCRVAEWADLAALEAEIRSLREALEASRGFLSSL